MNVLQVESASPAKTIPTVIEEDSDDVTTDGDNSNQATTVAFTDDRVNAFTDTINGNRSTNIEARSDQPSLTDMVLLGDGINEIEDDQ